MTNEKLGVLLTNKKDTLEYISKNFAVKQSYFSEFVEQNAYRCTEDEAKKGFPQFTWVALEDL